MFKFIKTKDKKNKFDHSNVEILIKYNDLILTDLLDIFTDFLRACGFTISGRLVIEPYEEEREND